MEQHTAVAAAVAAAVVLISSDLHRLTTQQAGRNGTGGVQTHKVTPKRSRNAAGSSEKPRETIYNRLATCWH